MAGPLAGLGRPGKNGVHPIALAVVEPGADKAREEDQNASGQADARNELGFQLQGDRACANAHRTDEPQDSIHPLVHCDDASALIEPRTDHADEEENDAEAEPDHSPQRLAQHGRGKQADAADDGAQ